MNKIYTLQYMPLQADSPIIEKYKNIQQAKQVAHFKSIAFEGSYHHIILKDNKGEKIFEKFNKKN